MLLSPQDPHHPTGNPFAQVPPVPHIPTLLPPAAATSSPPSCLTNGKTPSSRTMSHESPGGAEKETPGSAVELETGRTRHSLSHSDPSRIRSRSPCELDSRRGRWGAPS